MERTWYLRMAAVLAAAVFGWLALWPSLGDFLPAPAWVTDTFTSRISPGLDIRGGLRLMYEVEVDEYIRDQRDRMAEQMVRDLGVLLEVISDDERDSAAGADLEEIQNRVTVERVGGRKIRITFQEQADFERFDNEWLFEHFPELRRTDTEGRRVELSMNQEGLTELRENAVTQAAETITRRIDEYGVREASVIPRETDADVIIEVPGATEQQFNEIREIVQRTARLEFKICDDENDFVGGLELERIEDAGLERFAERVPVGPDNAATTSYLGAVGEDARERLAAFVSTLEVSDDHQLLLGEWPPDSRPQGVDIEQPIGFRTYYLNRSTDVTGEDIEDARVGFDQQSGNQPLVLFQMRGDGADQFGEMTTRNTQRRMAIVLDDLVSSAPNINEPITGGRGQITLGSSVNYNETMDEAEQLTIVLRAGALPAPLRPANEQLIGPTLGADSVRRGAQGAAIGVFLVLIFMAVYYEVAGLVADLMVLLNLLLLLSLMAALEATLTLPGIAAVALTVGMAVDANVLITERIREELRAGKSPRSAVDQGFGRAFWSVFDSQLTTFIAGVVLFQYGTGPIKGFAVMLMLGIVTSLFTGIFASKVVLDFIVRGLKVKRLRVG